MSPELLTQFLNDPGSLKGTVWSYTKIDSNSAFGLDNLLIKIVEVVDQVKVLALLINQLSDHASLEVATHKYCDITSFTSDPSALTYLGTLKELSWLHVGSMVKRKGGGTQDICRIQKVASNFIYVQTTPRAAEVYHVLPISYTNFTRNWEAASYTDKMRVFDIWHLYDSNFGQALHTGMQAILFPQAVATALSAESSEADEDEEEEGDEEDIQVDVETSRHALLTEDPFK